MSVELDHEMKTLWTLLFHIVTDIEDRIASHIATHQLTPPQFYVIKTLFEHDGRCAIGQIAREHHLTNATMTGLVKRLEKQEPPLVTREQSMIDRRSIDVILTDAGYERFDQIRIDLLQQVKAMLALLDDEGRQSLINYASYYVNFVMDQFPNKKPSGS